MAAHPATQPVPDQVLEHLYIGGKAHAKAKDVLQRLGITHVVNVSEEVRNYFQREPMFVYHQISVQDTASSRLDSHFSAACDFIDAALEQRHGVLVHCSQGVSRSASVVIAHLIRSQRLSLAQAYQLLRNVRPIVRPKPNFLKQLVLFERSLGRRAPSAGASVGGAAAVSGPSPPPAASAAAATTTGATVTGPQRPPAVSIGAKRTCEQAELERPAADDDDVAASSSVPLEQPLQQPSQEQLPCKRLRMTSAPIPGAEPGEEIKEQAEASLE